MNGDKNFANAWQEWQVLFESGPVQMLSPIYHQTIPREGFYINPYVNQKPEVFTGDRLPFIHFDIFFFHLNLKRSNHGSDVQTIFQ